MSYIIKRVLLLGKLTDGFDKTDSGDRTDGWIGQYKGYRSTAILTVATVLVWQYKWYWPTLRPTVADTIDLAIQGVLANRRTVEEPSTWNYWNLV